jgi:hypothetical protein
MIRLFSAFLLLATASAAPLRILAIGDSLTEEYHFELTFSAPQSDPANANVMNWPELIGKFRAAGMGTIPMATECPIWWKWRWAAIRANFPRLSPEDGGRVSASAGRPILLPRAMSG